MTLAVAEALNPNKPNQSYIGGTVVMREGIVHAVMTCKDNFSHQI